MIGSQQVSKERPEPQGQSLMPDVIECAAPSGKNTSADLYSGFSRNTSARLNGDGVLGV